jgi:hypothetical protein
MQHARHAFPDAGVVIDDEDARHGRKCIQIVLKVLRVLMVLKVQCSAAEGANGAVPNVLRMPCGRS